MKQKIVGMVSSYKGLQEQRDWLWRQTPHPLGVWENISLLATAPRPDYLLMYQFDFPRPQPPAPWWQKLRHSQGKSRGELDVPSLLRGVPKERIIYLLREPPLPEVIATNQANYEAAQQYCGYISGPDHFAPVPDYMPAIWYIGNSFLELDTMPPPTKVKSCSWITSGIARTASHRQRLAFLRLLGEHQIEFDLYGRGLPDWAGGLGTLNNKWSGMAPYYYNLSIENFADNELYVSEKLWDALLAWCLPIYYGGGAADKLLPAGSFLRLPSLDEKGLQYLQTVISTPDAWHQARQAIAEARQIVLHELNLLAWLSNFVEKVA
jgi:hypothetical protein